MSKIKILYFIFVIFVAIGVYCVVSSSPKVPEPILGWSTTTDNNVTFQYPETLTTEYIHTVDWPPKVQVLNEPFTCIEAGLENNRAGQTTQLTIGDRIYCVTKESEGAAGSVYTNYAYAFAKNDATLIFTFSLRAVQCANYDEPQRTACANERASFDINNVIDRMTRSIQ